MSVFPSQQIEDAHKLQADAEIFLYELTPSVGGTMYFKSDNPVTWQGNLYEGLPLQFSGASRSTEIGTGRPTLTIGDTNLDLGPFKPLLFDGYAEGAAIIRRRVLLTAIEDNLDQSSDEHYKVRQTSDYGRTSITLELARAADSLEFSFPFHQYYAPDFPSVLA
jgi:phage-related protein